MKTIKNEQIWQYLLIFSFLFIIFLPLTDQILRIFPDTKSFENKIFPDTPLFENRQLATISGIEAGGILNFPKQFENYYNDNFGLRKYLIKGNNILKIRLLSVSPNTKVVLGKEKWLYYAPDKSFYDYKKKHTEEELKLYLDTLKDRKDWFNSKGIQYFIVIVPDKQSLYPEYLPEYIQRLNMNSGYDQIKDYLSENSLDINIDAKKSLLKSKQEGDLVYYETDSHWNDYGAFLAYQEMMKKLEANYPELSPVPLTDFDIVEKKYSGDLTQMLGMEEYFKEKVYFLIPKNKRKANFYEVGSINGIATKKPMQISQCSSCSNFTAVIIRDSQGIPLIPFLGEHFSRAVFIDATYGENPEILHTIIQNEKPDIVLHEIVERNINDIFYQAPNVSFINIKDSMIEQKGTYEDKWTAKEASFTFRTNHAPKIRIQAYLTEEVFKKVYNSLLKVKVNVNREEAGFLELTKENFNDGNFNIELNVPSDNENITVDIMLDKSFVPEKYLLGEDDRELGIILKDISFKYDLKNE